MRFAPSAPFTSGLDTVIRGSFSLTVTPSGTGEGGGVAYGCATSAALAVGLAAGVGLPDDAAGRGLRSQAARMVDAAAALPAISVTRRMSSRREMNPSRKSSTCSSMKYRWVSFSRSIGLLRASFVWCTCHVRARFRPKERGRSPARGGRDCDLCGEVSHDLRGGGVGAKHRERAD